MPSKPSPRRTSARPEHERLLATDSFVRPSFTLEQIRTFLVVASREHITHAAQVLRLSQPAVTQQIQLLERALGVQLLERIGRNVRLTNAGVEVAGVCLLVMRALENLEEVADAIRGLTLGTVSVGASPLATNYFLPRVITDFAAVHPQINVAVVVTDPDDVCRQVASGQLECGLVEGTPAANPALARSRVATTDMVLVGHPDHAVDTSTGPAPQMGRGSRLLVWPAGSKVDAISARLLGVALDQVRQLDIGSLEAARQLILRAPGYVAVLPSVAVAADLGSGALQRIYPRSVALPVFAVRRQGAEGPAADALWATMVQSESVSRR